MPVRAFYMRIAEDEARHAAPAFETTRFLVDREPALAGDVARVVGRLGPEERAFVGGIFAAAFPDGDRPS